MIGATRPFRFGARRKHDHTPEVIRNGSLISVWIAGLKRPMIDRGYDWNDGSRLLPLPAQRFQVR